MKKTVKSEEKIPILEFYVDFCTGEVYNEAVTATVTLHCFLKGVDSGEQ